MENSPYSHVTSQHQHAQPANPFEDNFIISDDEIERYDTIESLGHGSSSQRKVPLLSTANDKSQQRSGLFGGLLANRNDEYIGMENGPEERQFKDNNFEWWTVRFWYP